MRPSTYPVDQSEKNRAVVFESAISLLPWTALQFMGFRIRGFIGSHFNEAVGRFFEGVRALKIE